MCIATGNLSCRPSRQAQNLSGKKRSQSEVSKHRDLETWTVKAPESHPFGARATHAPGSGMLLLGLSGSVVAEVKTASHVPSWPYSAQEYSLGNAALPGNCTSSAALWEENPTATEF